MNKYFIDDNGLTPEDLAKIEAIDKFYLKDQWSLQNISNAFGDAKFVYGTEKMAKQLAKYTKTFYYHFVHQGAFSISDIFSSTRPNLLWTLIKKAFGFHESKNLGVCHADDLLYLFK